LETGRRAAVTARLRCAAERSLLVLFCLLFAQIGATDQNAPAPKPCTAPEHRQFDFWAGNWTVTDPSGKTVGTNRIEVVEGGCGLEERWTAAAGSGSGRSLNAFSAHDGHWYQTWLGSDGLVLVLRGEFRDGRMILAGETVTPKVTMRHRLTWTPLGDGRVRQLWEQSTDAGKTWTVAFNGLYTKK
jgi:hypothetical protein